MPAYLQLRLKIVSTFAGQRVQYFCHSYHMLQESNIALYQNKCGILWFVLLCASVLAKSSCPFQFNWKWTRSILLVKVASPKRGPVDYAILFCCYLVLQCRSINSWGIKSLMLKCILIQFQLRVFFPSQAHLQAHQIPPHLYLCCPQELFQPCLHLLMHLIVLPHPPYLPYPPQYHHLFLLHNPVCPHFLQCYHIHIHPHHILLLFNLHQFLRW